MKIGSLSILTLLVSLCAMTPVRANTAVIHNETPYLLQITEWHTKGVCRVQKNILINPNAETKILWGHCISTKSVWGLMLDKKLIDNVVTVDDKTYYPSGERHFYVTNEEKSAYQEDPMHPGQSIEVQKYVRFTVKIDPSGIFRGGRYQGNWVNKITHRLATDEEIKQEGLD